MFHIKRRKSCGIHGCLECARSVAVSISKRAKKKAYVKLAGPLAKQ
jgi:hypothetical protein